MTAAQNPEALALHDSLKVLAPDEFRRAIRMIDDESLADLRYVFGYDPTDSRKSSWQTIAINRLLTRRRDWRVARPQWIGIIVTGLIGIAALIVALFK